MWQPTGNTLNTTVPRVELIEVESDAGEGTAYEVHVLGQLFGRVQVYSGTIELGHCLVRHGPTWAYTPLVESARYGTSAGRTVFGFGTADDAVIHGLRAR